MDGRMDNITLIIHLNVFYAVIPEIFLIWSAMQWFCWREWITSVFSSGRRSLWWFSAFSSSGISESVFCHVWGGSEWHENWQHPCNPLFSGPGSAVFVWHHSAEEKRVTNWGNSKCFSWTIVFIWLSLLHAACVSKTMLFTSVLLTFVLCIASSAPHQKCFIFVSYFTKYNLALVFTLLKWTIISALLSYTTILMLGMKNRPVLFFLL